MPDAKAPRGAAECRSWRSKRLNNTHLLVIYRAQRDIGIPAGYLACSRKAFFTFWRAARQKPLKIPSPVKSWTLTQLVHDPNVQVTFNVRQRTGNWCFALQKLLQSPYPLLPHMKESTLKTQIQMPDEAPFSQVAHAAHTSAHSNRRSTEESLIFDPILGHDARSATSLGCS